MGKKFIFSSLIGLFLFAFPGGVKASLVKVSAGGEVLWTVLSDQDSSSLEIPRHSYIEVKKAGEVEPDQETSVSLLKNDGKPSLVVMAGNETRELDVSGMAGDLVEIEERPETQRIFIGVSGDKFSLQQKSIKALTDYPVVIDSKTAEIFLTTPSGNRFLSILPSQATDVLMRSNLLTKVKENLVEIVEEGSELQYLIEGERELGLFDVFNYTVEVKSRVSASTGEVLSVEAPVWYKVVAMLLT